MSRFITKMKIIQIKVAGLILIILFLIQICFDPITFIRLKDENKKTQEELNIAREKWQSSRIKSYAIEVEGGIPLACFYSSTITVHEGELYDVKTHQDLFDKSSSLITVPSKDWESSFCDYTKLTISAIFEKVEDSLKNNNSDKVIVAFDDSYGYVTKFQYQCNVKNGLMDPKISDCGFRLDFSNFTIITNPD